MPSSQQPRTPFGFIARLGVSILGLSVLDASAAAPHQAGTEGELAAAIRKATKPATIYFTPSGRTLALRDLKPTVPITIDGRGAKLEGLTIERSAAIRLVNFEFVAVHANGTDPFKILDSDDITLERLNIHGSLDNDPSNDTSAMQIRRSTRVKLKKLEFHELANAVTHLDCDDVVFSDNFFHNIRMDGIRGGGSSNVTVERNYFTDFKPLPADHPDAIQFWNSNTKTPASNILIRNNLIARGNGGPPQGIFVTTQISRLRYQGVKIHNNIVIGSLYHAITVSGADDVEISANTVITYPDIGARISVDKSTNVRMTSNSAPTFLRGKDVAFSYDKQNKKSHPPKDRGAALIKSWLADQPDQPATQQ